MKPQRTKRKEPTPTTKNKSCFVRFPPDVYDWLQTKAATKYRSVQQQVIEIVIATREAESEEQAA